MTTYRDAGVDIDAQDRALEKIKDMVRSTYTPGVLSDQGSFGGLFEVPEDMEKPVLVSSADGVGTKLKIAFLSGRHETIGRDLVHHCINDILVQGARPLFFLDYLATGRLDPGVAAEIISGVAGACVEHGMALLGGETAEMPGFYAEGEYDLAGFIVGIVEASEIIDGTRVREGDVLVALPSDGLHTNGYSLARRVFFDIMGCGIDDHLDELGCTVADELLKPHRCYLEEILPEVRAGRIHAMAHITGGGIVDNLPRVLPKKRRAVIKVGAWEIPSVFSFLAREGDIPDDEMWRSFNMGVGMILVVDPGDLVQVMKGLQERGCPGAPIGRIVKGKRGVEFDHPPKGYPSGWR